MSQTSPPRAVWSGIINGDLGGPSYEKVLTRKRGACGDACRTSDGSGHADSPATAAGRLLRLDWRLYRL